jgi:nickel/cobalt transporter (NicO) family protein
MYSIFIGSVLLSLLHALIPSHWLPILAIGKKENWNLNEVSRVTFIAGLSHVLSTVLIGGILGLLGLTLAVKTQYFTHFIAPVVLILLGLYFLFQHHRHHHFHLGVESKPVRSKSQIIWILVVTMFLSPCLEIQAYFLLAGIRGLWTVVGIALIYLTLTLAGMVMWVRLAFKGMLKLDWHGMEHKSGMIAGWTLIITGIISFFIS